MCVKEFFLHMELKHCACLFTQKEDNFELKILPQKGRLYKDEVINTHKNPINLLGWVGGEEKGNESVCLSATDEHLSPIGVKASL